MITFSYPSQPTQLEDTGLDRNFLFNLIAKIMSELGTITPGELANEIKLARSVTSKMIDEMVALELMESRGLASTDIKSEIRYTLSAKGRQRAAEAMLMSQYIGPAPVTLKDFEIQVKEQGISHEAIHKDDLSESLSHLVLPPGIMSQIGPAANSARSVLLYGEPGNGKTSIAEALCSAFKATIYIPYALIVGNQIIQFFDETLHQRVDAADDGSDKGTTLDPRWVPCRRPVVITGGELTLDVLDLSFDPQTRFYEAPMHLKALGGIFVIDDFGRQRTTTREILNRWIIPLEQGHDILTLHTGKKFTIPFDQLVIFSTNLVPHDIADEAALRRLYFKIFVPSPSKIEYLKIFKDVCSQHGIEFHLDVVNTFFEEKYVAQNAAPSGAHPNFLLMHIISACAYEEWEPVISKKLLDLAWKNVATGTAKSTRRT